MTNLEWLANLKMEEASDIMMSYCPFHENNACSKKCLFYCDDHAHDIASQLKVGFIDWLLAEREGNDA